MIKTLIKKILYTLLSRFIVQQGTTDSIYITFDDGPHPDNTLRILETLEIHNVHATFFMTGLEMMKHQGIVKKVSAAGHVIAYHGYAHTSMKKQNIRDFTSDILKAKELEQIFGIKLALYRPPYGDISLSGFLYLMTHGWKIIMWSLDSRDSFDTLEQVKNNVSARSIKPGEIILFHDDYDKTASLLDSILSDYKTAKLNISTSF